MVTMAPEITKEAKCILGITSKECLVVGTQGWSESAHSGHTRKDRSTSWSGATVKCRPTPLWAKGPRGQRLALQ
ncbi:MAG: hypothetical protein H6Q00_1598 [Holophagaceae bacterium]|nr:hypothetical protein [Holophagaceae bacterium]